ncbi:MAG: DsbA family oxidoreductase [Cytophagaceae bacterium]|nr:DsbA family oxidoreductase [Cytophagaceae bacterium]
MARPKIKIDIVSDVVCPWCYIGKRRLEKAVDELKNDFDFEIKYHPFELNPAIPKKGYNYKNYLSEKFGGDSRFEQLTKHVSNVASEEGLLFNLDKQEKSPNTLDAHRIIWLASQENKDKETVEVFFKAFFEEGVDLTTEENLIKVAVKAGLDEAKVKAMLKSDTGIREVEEAEEHNRNMGVTGVPFYIINDKYGLTGAQPAEVFVNALKQISNEAPVTGESCDVDGENC